MLFTFSQVINNAMHKKNEMADPGVAYYLDHL